MPQRIGVRQISKRQLNIDARSAEVLWITHQHAQGTTGFDQAGQ
jgi:hypothetical protein